MFTQVLTRVVTKLPSRAAELLKCGDAELSCGAGLPSATYITCCSSLDGIDTGP